MKQRENAKELILSRGVQIASVEGLNGLTIGHLAQALNMSKGGICAHYASKSMLQLAVVEKAANLFKQYVIKPSFQHPAGLARLQALSDAWFEYIEAGIFQGGCFFTNAVLELDDLEDTQVRAAVAQLYQQFLDFIEENVCAAKVNGEFRADLDTAQFTFEYMGVKLSALLWRGLGRSETPLAIARQTRTTLFQRAGC